MAMMVRLNQWLVDTQTGSISLEGSASDAVYLDHTPLKLLLCLIRHQGTDVSKETMLNEVWSNKVVTEEVLSVAISQIRKKLGDDARKPEIIKTIPGHGYRLIAKVEAYDERSDDQQNKHADANLFTGKKVFYGLMVLTFLIIGYWFVKYQVKGDDVLTKSIPKEISSQYQKGRYLMTLNGTEHWLQAEQIFKNTIINFPEYAPAYEDLARAQFNMAIYGNQKKPSSANELNHLLKKAMQLAPGQASTYLLLAKVSFMLEWDFKQAHEYYKKSIQIDPESASAHFNYAQFLLAAEAYELALLHTERYIDLKPEGYATSAVAWIYNMMGDYESALEELNNLKQYQSNSLEYHISAQAILENIGDEAASFAELKAIFKLKNYSDLELKAADEAFGANGLSGVYQWLLEVKQEKGNIGQYLPPLSLARYATKAGKDDLASQYIIQAAQEKQFELLWFNADPKYQKLRERAELQNIIVNHMEQMNR